MAQASARTKASPAADAGSGHRIIDVVEVRTSYGAPAPSFILVPEGLHSPEPEALVGEVVVIEPPGGWAILGKISGARDHGPTTSLLVENWPADFPRPIVGWRVQVPAVDADCAVDLGYSADKVGESGAAKAG